MSKTNFAESIRAFSNNLKATKEQAATAFVRTATNGVLDACEDYLAQLKLMMAVLNTGVVGAKVVRDDPKLREQLETLVAHTIGDFAARVNEAANFCEALVKHEAVQESAAEVMSVGKELVGLVADKKKSGKRSRIRIVRGTDVN